MNERWIVLYINCVGGTFEPFGPFDSKEKAQTFKGMQTDQELFEVMRITPA